MRGNAAADLARAIAPCAVRRAVGGLRLAANHYRHTAIDRESLTGDVFASV